VTWSDLSFVPEAGVEPGGLARQVVALGEVGCLVGRLGVQPCCRRQVADALVEVRRHFSVCSIGSTSSSNADSRGCRYFATDLAFADPRHPAHAETEAFRRRLHGLLVRELGAFGHASRKRGAEQLHLLIEGTLVMGATQDAISIQLAPRATSPPRSSTDEFDAVGARRAPGTTRVASSSPAKARASQATEPR
jgi:hypothetical protein